MQTYINIDQRIHQLCQTIAKFNIAFALRKEDYSQTNLALDPVGMRVFGRWAEAPQGKVILALTFNNFKFEIFNDSCQSLFSVEIDSKTQSQTEEILKNFLPQIGLDSKKFSDPLGYEISKYDFANNLYLRFNESELADWIHHRSLANDACLWLMNHLQTSDEIRIWPHHFDTGIYTEPNSKTGLGFGLAMQDGMVKAPYYYFTGYGLNGHTINFDLTDKLNFGYWIKNENWKGAVLKLSDANPKTIKEFILEVSQWYFNH